LKFIKDSLKFIAGYCIKNNISLNEYVSYKDGVTYAWAQHLKNYNICIYPLLVLDNFKIIVDSMPEDEKDLFLRDNKDVLIFRTKLIKSKMAKVMIKKGMKKINEIIKNYVDKV